MSVIDEILKDAIARGEFSNLPGTGKPLKLDDESHVPEELRMAHRILRENDLAPDWIMDSKEIAEAREKLLNDIRAAVRRHQAALNEAAQSDQPNQRRQAAESMWAGRLKGLREQVEKLNKRILSYNLKVPFGVQHILMIHLEQMINKMV